MFFVMRSTTKKVDVLLVEDHRVLREAITLILNAEQEFNVCGEAADANAALALIDKLHPEIVILDLTLDSGDGLEALAKIKERYPEIKVLVFSGRSEAIYAIRCLRAGASGYVRKEEPTEKLIAALKKVSHGGVYLNEELETHLLKQLTGGKGKIRSSPIESLSNRELQIFKLYGQGRGTRSIAAELGLSPKTVEVHRARIKEKLGIKTPTELVRHAVEWVEHGE